MLNNEACFAKLVNLKTIEGADRIKSANVAINGISIALVVVSSDIQENTEIIYFDSNLCLTDAVIKQYPVYGTYLAKNNRVRAIKLKGTISNGLIIEYEKMKIFDESLSFEEGKSFLKIGTTEICYKYAPPINISLLSNTKARKLKSKTNIVDGQFNFHFDTSNFFRNAMRISPESLISVSRKLHGTSWVVSNCLHKTSFSKFQNILIKIINLFGFNVVDSQYKTIAASRRVIKLGEDSGYYKFDLWNNIKDSYFKYNLQPGETIYGEAVGYLPNGSHIQKNFTYNASPNTFDIYVYRITKTDVTGNVNELGWSAMKERTMQLGVKFVPEYYYGKAKDLFNIPIDNEWNVNFANKIKEEYLNKNANDCGKNIPDEGVVIRIEGYSIESLKAKSENFIVYESNQKEIEDDIEDLN